jgi:hypothetical protein
MGGAEPVDDMPKVRRQGVGPPAPTSAVARVAVSVTGG